MDPDLGQRSWLLIGILYILFRRGFGVIVSNTGYIEYYEGNLSLILAAPHGGYDTPDSIQFNRDAGCLDSESQQCVYSHSCGTKDFNECGVTTLRDGYTKELALLLREEIYNETGKYPYLIINNLHRKKMDANRDRPEATFGEAVPEEAWDEFHYFINQSEVAIGGRGLFLDIHGHAHAVNWAEIGYLIYGSRLDSGSFDASDSSIHYLSTQVNVTFEQLLRGTRSFGGFLADNGYVAVPSPTNPGPSGNSYFSGGYNTKRYGSKSSGMVDAIQIESSVDQRSNAGRPQYVKALAKTVKSYLEEYYPDLLPLDGDTSASVAIETVTTTTTATTTIDRTAPSSSTTTTDPTAISTTTSGTTTTTSATTTTTPTTTTPQVAATTSTTLSTSLSASSLISSSTASSSSTPENTEQNNVTGVSQGENKSCKSCSDLQITASVLLITVFMIIDC